MVVVAVNYQAFGRVGVARIGFASLPVEWETISNRGMAIQSELPASIFISRVWQCEWLAVALWRDCKGDATIKIKPEVIKDWRSKWFWIYQLNCQAAHCRFLNRIQFANADSARSFGVGGWKGTPSKASVVAFPDTEHYSLTRQGEWVEHCWMQIDFGSTTSTHGHLSVCRKRLGF